MRHPKAVLFAGEKPFPILPAVDHYAGSEKLMRKALQLQKELGPIFDITRQRIVQEVGPQLLALRDRVAADTGGMF